MILPIGIGLGVLIVGLAIRKYVRYNRYVGEVVNSLSRYHVGKNQPPPDKSGVLPLPNDK